MKKLLYILIFITSTSFSQSNVWVKIPNFNSYGIQFEGGKITSRDSKLNGIISTHSITNIFKAVPSSKNPDLRDLYQLDCNCNPEDLVKDISKGLGIFEGAEVGPSYESLSVPNDYYTSGVSNYALELINAPGAWDEELGNPVTIAITDANYYLSHEDLIGKYDYVSPSNSGTNYAHGTAVAITAGGNTNNGLGISSIGYESRLQLRAMTYNEILSATYSGAKVINCSWASGCYFNSYAQAIIDEAYFNGSIIVASAGNGGTCGGSSNLVYPASYDHVISVTSVGPLGNHERFMGDPTSTHQHNSMVDISAPGYDVLVSTSPGVYVSANGTSFASPFVSGTVALMLSVNPCLSFEDIEYILKETSDSTIYSINSSYLGGLGNGLLNSELAVRMAKSYSTISGEIKKIVDCITGKTHETIISLGGISPYTYSWSNGGNGISTEIEADGDLKVWVKDSLGCIFSDSAHVEKYSKISVNTQITNVKCFGESNGGIELEILGGFNPQEPTWESGLMGRSIGGLSKGEYSFIIVDEYDCFLSDTVRITQPNELTSEISFINPSSSSNGSIEVTIEGGVLPYTYQWNTGESSEDLYDLSPDFYELLVIDFNGCMTSTNASLSQEIGETQNLSIEENEENEFTIYPNPSDGQITIKKSKNENSKIEIRDFTGKSIYSEKIFTNEITLNDLSTGVYLIEVDGTTKKVIIK